MIADTAPLVRESCDRCGPYVAARYFVQTNNGPLAFCAHDVNYVIPVTLAATASEIPGIDVVDAPVSDSLESVPA